MPDDMTPDEVLGVEAIVVLQDLADIVESPEAALHGWRMLSPTQRQSALGTYARFYPFLQPTADGTRRNLPWHTVESPTAGQVHLLDCRDAIIASYFNTETAEVLLANANGVALPESG